MAITISGSGITSANIADGTIVNADINSSAAIDGSKLTGGGKVLQVVEATSGTYYSTTSTTETYSGHSITITPSSTSSKVLVSFTANINLNTGSAGGMEFVFYRNTTKIGDNGIAYDHNATNSHMPISQHHLDAPSTTTAVQYKLYVKSNTGTSVRLAGDWGLVRFIAMEIAG